MATCELFNETALPSLHGARSWKPLLTTLCTPVHVQHQVTGFGSGWVEGDYNSAAIIGYRALLFFLATAFIMRAVVWRFAKQGKRLVRPMLFEHVNLNVPDVEVARTFYVRGLGGVENPVGTNHRQLHVNAGASQFHLPTQLSVEKAEPVTVPQVWPGVITLWTTEDLWSVQTRLLGQVGAEAEIKMDPMLWPGRVQHSGEAELHACCPWGNRFVLRRVPPGFAVAGRHAGGHGALVAMPSVMLEVKPGAAAVIADFYSRILCCAAACEQGPVGEMCTVTFDQGQTLVFKETEAAPPADAYDRDEASAYHVCVYLPTEDAFARAFGRASAANLLFVNQRFQGGPPEFASAATWDEALRCGQFRVKDVVDESSGALALVLEHEVRSPAHKSCPRKRHRNERTS